MKKMIRNLILAFALLVGTVVPAVPSEMHGTYGVLLTDINGLSMSEGDLLYYHSGHIVNFPVGTQNYIFGSSGTDPGYYWLLDVGPVSNNSDIRIPSQKAVYTAIPVASTTTPSMDGSAAYGSGTTWARSDHVHPSDTSRLPLTGGNLSGALNEAKGADIASATTTDIGAATGDYVEITGAVTITGLGTIQAGARRVVRFTGSPAPLLTYNVTSLILPGSRNIQAEFGDRAEFISLGSGNWVCTNFLKFNGSVLGDVVVVADSSTSDIDALYMRRHTHRVTGAYTLSIPTAAIGLNACFLATTAAVFSIDVKTATDIMILNGVSLTAGNKATSDGSINATICVESDEAGYYRATAILGVFSDGGA